MAQYTITRSCGHEETVRLYGPGKDRERKIAWMEQTLCRDCYRAEQARADEEVIGTELPALTGTPKQVTWAEDIRREKLAKVAEEMTKFISSAPADTPAETLEETNSVLQTAYNRLAEQTSARWWIDARHRTPRDLMREMHEA